MMAFQEVIIRGNGEIGGKAADLNKTIRFLNEKQQQGSISQGLEQLLSIPDTICLATGYFDEFMANLSQDVKDEILKAEAGKEYQYSIIEQGILHAALPAQLTEDLKGIVRTHTGPLAVRTSSIYEDRPDAPLAGAYQTQFIPNQGTEDERLWQLSTAVKKVYTSAYGHDPIERRKRFGLLGEPDKMAVMIQNLVGINYGDYFLPLLGGVVLTENPRLWSADTKKGDGMVRMVFGSATRAVDRGETRIYSFERNMRGYRLPRPEGSTVEEIISHAQKEVDVFNLKTGRIETLNVKDLITCDSNHFPGSNQLIRVLSGEPGNQRLWETGNSWDTSKQYAVLYFDDFLREKFASGITLVEAQQELSGILKESFNGEDVDWEFVFCDGKLYLLQSRALTKRAEHMPVNTPHYATEDPDGHIFLEAEKDIPSRGITGIDYIIYIDRTEYQLLRMQDKHQVARVIGKLNRQLREKNARFILIGPSRWGNTDASEGIPVKAGEILNASALIEYTKLDGQDGPIYDLSYGSHFFFPLMRADITYIPLKPHKNGRIFRDDVFQQANGTHLLEGESDALLRTIKVLDVRKAYGTTAAIALNGKTEKGALYLEMSNSYRTLDGRIISSTGSAAEIPGSTYAS